MLDSIENIVKSGDWWSFDIPPVSYKLNPSSNALLNNLEGWDRYNGYRISESFIGRTATFGRTDYTGAGYLSVPLLGGTVRVHRLVAFLKYGMEVFSKQVDHVSGDRRDNSEENIRLCSPKENIANAISRGSFEGKSRFHGKLKEKEVLDIIRKGKSSRYLDIAADYEVSASTISRICNYKTSGARYVKEKYNE
tara:strand:- start:6205 stop:6786 length:582 start_codon:yes stop_codon:yes gene_type:complete